MGNFKEDIALVEALVFDVDGVFTDGGITLLPDGDFLRCYNAKDGYAIVRALRAGYKVAIITGGWGPMLEKRFRMLGVTDLHTRCLDDKPARLRSFMENHCLQRDQVLYMGDDLPDIDCMEIVGMPVCPADAAVEVVQAARYVSQFDGGKGCVRDVVEQVLRARGDWGKHETTGYPANGQ